MAVIPKNPLGKWSIGLILGFFLFLILFFILVGLGQRGGDTFFSNLLLTIPMLIAVASAIGSFVVGIIGIIKKERAILVFISILIGLMVFVYSALELLFPH